MIKFLTRVHQSNPTAVQIKGMSLDSSPTLDHVRLGWCLFLMLSTYGMVGGGGGGEREVLAAGGGGGEGGNIRHSFSSFVRPALHLQIHNHRFIELMG